MPSGITTTGSLTDSLETVIDAARVRREYPPKMPQLCTMHKLEPNTGLSWDEIELNRFTAQAITETTILENWQEFSDLLRSITPTMTGITTLVTDRTYRRCSKKTIAQMGTQAQAAIERKKDIDGIATLDGFTNSTPGAGLSLGSGSISAAVANITGNTTEGAEGSISTLLHPFQLKDIQDEITVGVGTFAIPDGLTEEYFKQGLQGTIYGTNAFVDGNIPIDSSSDAKGGVFAKMAIDYVQGAGYRTATKRRDEIGGGADQMFHYDEYAYGERTSNAVSVFGWEIYSDATAPTG